MFVQIRELCHKKQEETVVLLTKLYFILFYINNIVIAQIILNFRKIVLTT